MAGNQIQFGITFTTDDLDSVMGHIREVSDETTQSIGAGWTQASSTAIDGLKNLATQSEQTSSRTKEQIEKASNAASILGDLVGVSIPNGLQKMLAESEVMGPVLEAAFPVAAGLAFVQAIAQMSEKLSQLIADTYIYTDAEKEAYHQLTAQNSELVQIAERTKQLRRERMLLEAPDEAAKDKLRLQFQIEDQGGSSKDYADRAQAKMKELADFKKQTVQLVDSEVGGTAVVFTQPGCNGPCERNGQGAGNGLHNCKRAGHLFECAGGSGADQRRFHHAAPRAL